VAHNGAEATVAQLRPKPDLEELQVLLRGLAHVDRLQIIRLMADGKERSPRMLTDFLAPVQLGAVAYHVRFLRDRDLLKQVREEPRRGALEHFYAITDEGLRMKKWLRL
jgi:DNA-binding transcriptional ArsR family regulator